MVRQIVSESCRLIREFRRSVDYLERSPSFFGKRLRPARAQVETLVATEQMQTPGIGRQV